MVKDSDLSVLCSLIPRNRIGHTSVDTCFVWPEPQKGKRHLSGCRYVPKDRKKTTNLFFLAALFPSAPRSQHIEDEGMGGANEMV